MLPKGRLILGFQEVLCATMPSYLDEESFYGDWLSYWHIQLIAWYNETADSDLALYLDAECECQINIILTSFG